MKINRSNIDFYLRDWGNVVAEKLRSSGYPSSAGIQAVIGSQAAHSTIPIDDSWPYPDLARINNAIKSLPEVYSQPIYLQRVEGHTYHEIREIIGLSYGGVVGRIDKAESELISAL